MADLDAVVMGAGFAGIYAVKALRDAGLNVEALEAGTGIGGTWYWNCYPGARCDVESLDSAEEVAGAVLEHGAAGIMLFSPEGGAPDARS